MHCWHSSTKKLFAVNKNDQYSCLSFLNWINIIFYLLLCLLYAYISQGYLGHASFQSTCSNYYNSLFILIHNFILSAPLLLKINYTMSLASPRKSPWNQIIEHKEEDINALTKRRRRFISMMSPNFPYLIVIRALPVAPGVPLLRLHSPHNFPSPPLLPHSKYVILSPSLTPPSTPFLCPIINSPPLSPFQAHTGKYNVQNNKCQLLINEDGGARGPLWGASLKL